MSLIRYGDRFRLRWVSRKRRSAPLYLISAEKGGRENYPRMGSIAEAVLLVFAAPHGPPNDRTGQPVSSRATVQLATTEAGVGAGNTIGAWNGDHFLYYHAPGRPEQDWQIEVESRGLSDGNVHAGDFIAFHHRQSSEHRMAQDAKQPDYLALDPSARGVWQIELEPPDAPAP
jgi:hypothetical protein